MKTDQIIKDLKRISPTLKALLQAIENVEYGTDYSDDLEAEYTSSMLLKIGDNLDAVRRLTIQLTSDVSVEGVLRHNSSKRYQIEGSDEYFTSGSSIEVLLEGWGRDRHESAWVYTRVEHNGEDYYLTCDPSICMEGLLARTKCIPC